MIKSGGEWISSIDLENVAVAHPAVAEAACIACAHPRWTERPLLVVVLRPGMDVTREELLAFYEGKVAKWWIPDDVVFVEALPHTATGKLQKLKLREMFREHVLPTASWPANARWKASRCARPGFDARARIERRVVAVSAIIGGRVSLRAIRPPKLFTAWFRPASGTFKL